MRLSRVWYISASVVIVAACGFPRPADVADCTSSPDCTSPDALFCEASSGTCVGCLDGTSCPTEKPVCDADEQSCRSCLSDNECASGICIEADGTCAVDSSVVFVSSIGVDGGDCGRATPCGSLTFALQKVTADRFIVRVTGGALSTDVSTITFTSPVVIDSDGTTFSMPSTGPLFAIANLVSGIVTIEGIAVRTNGAGGPGITIGAGSALRLFKAAIDHSVVQVNGSLDARKVKLTNSTITCTSGTVTVRESTFDTAGLSTSNCATTVVQNRFDLALDSAIDGRGGFLTVENNVFVVPSEFVDLIVATSNAPGSVIAFNTIVNTSTVVQSPVAITCDAGVKVTSNIIAYNSTNPINGAGCAAHASLFDAVGAMDAPGNPSGDVATFFKDRAAGEFHLATGSPARGIGEANIVTIDFDGVPRPTPSGSLPDVGAYEAP